MGSTPPVARTADAQPQWSKYCAQQSVRRCRSLAMNGRFASQSGHACECAFSRTIWRAEMRSLRGLSPSSLQASAWMQFCNLQCDAIAMLQWTTLLNSRRVFCDVWRRASTSPAGLYVRLQPFGIEESTIFRALNDLATAGLARRMELGDHVWRFGLAMPAETCQYAEAHHPHLLCVDCGSVTCLVDKDIQVKPPKSIGPIVDILLKGHCPSCVRRK